ncbi:MAG TPA: alpha/beta hydrolase [Aurantimonas sp.]|uniref:Alpha/beta hydrolase n=1 Tax=Aurantimonas marianensis TaxID=2920428 RepID=A0A9X2KEE9_9HYPH|nr:alpha/beta hydrolase [Aurantimonas marianensis]MCP3054190.1 alpha/beta hydrolase [Aurantimonas marianensis]
MNDAYEPSELVSSAGNPAPPGISASSFRTPDGKRLRYAIAPSQLPRTRGTIILLQGRNEAIEKYFETIADLTRRGYMVMTFDWRGQGGSQRIIRNTGLGYVRKFRNYVNDLESIVQDVVLPDCRGPYAILAHSMGGLIALQASPRLMNVIERMVLSAPLISFPPGRIGLRGLNRMARIAQFVGLGRLPTHPFQARTHEPSPTTSVLTSDPKRLERNQALAEAAPGLFLGSPTIAWLAAVSGAMVRLTDSDWIARLAIPTLIIAAGDDSVVATPAAERLAWRMRSGSSLTIPFARHELLQEADRFREPFLEAFEAFVGGVLPPD